jgi:quercetin dioxygenase-like cupin family protein
MKIKNLSEASPFDPDNYVAEEFLSGEKCNVRVIKLAPGIALPAHRHGQSDLMLYVAEGEAVLETADGPREFIQGELAYISPEEELRVSNQSQAGVTLLAFLTPIFPTRS